MLDKDLIALGVDPTVARSFAAATQPAPAPEVISENGAGQHKPAGYVRPPGYHLDPSSGFYVNSQGAVDPNDPAVAARLHGLNPSGQATLAPGAQSVASPGSPGEPVDWHQYLADWGFPPDVISQLDQIFRDPDTTRAQARALAYIRGTDWYAQTFPGIAEAKRVGLVSDEAGYRAYVNSLNQQYRNYFGRDVTTAEVADFMKKGINTNQVANHLQGQALIKANAGDIQYQLGAFGEGRASEDELAQYGDYLGGIGNMIGPELQRKIDMARQRMNAIMQGSLASPSLSIVGGRLTAQGLGNRVTNDVAA